MFLQAHEQRCTVHNEDLNILALKHSNVLQDLDFRESPTKGKGIKKSIQHCAGKLRDS